jgi:flagellar protein FlaG
MNIQNGAYAQNNFSGSHELSRAAAAHIADSFSEERKETKQRVTQAHAEAVRKFVKTLPGAGPGSGPSSKSVEMPHSGEGAIAELRRLSKTFNKRLEFVVDNSSNEVTVKVIDGETDKVIKILPPEELQRLFENNANGMLIDQSA